jgi:methylated-DNA-[protein]-cysteine S-methyltransferase
MKTHSASNPFVAQARIETPLGPLTATATAHGLAGLWFDGQSHHPGEITAPVRERDPFISAARRELAAYWRDGHAVFAVPLDPQGTPFQQNVWRLLCAIKAGDLESYGAMATQLGSPQAARAVGAAVGRNPISIIVPCHRVVGASGALTGYAGGLDRKQALLRLEGVLTEGGPAQGLTTSTLAGSNTKTRSARWAGATGAASAPDGASPKQAKLAFA